MMRITNSGNVGIGTSSPTALFEVNGPAKFDGVVNFASGQTFAGMATLGANTFTGMQTISNAGGEDGVSASGGNVGVYGNGNSVGVFGFSGSMMGVCGISGSDQACASSAGVYGGSSAGPGVYGFSSTGVALQGYSGSWFGVYGQTGGTNNGSTGVFGLANISSTNQVFGVSGTNSASNNGAGVYGQDSTSGKRSGTGNLLAGNGAGVWGDGGSDFVNDESNMGVVATADDRAALDAENNSASWITMWAYNHNSSGMPFMAKNSSGAGCNIDGSGNLNCSGAKHAIVPIDGGQRKVALSAIESPKNWFEDFGSAQLFNGSAVLAIEPEYLQTVNTEVEYHVFLTPNADCRGLYVSRRTQSSFEVRELNGGSSNIEFSYRIVALRKNFESIRLADHTHDLDVVQRMMANMGAPSRLDTSNTKQSDIHVSPISRPQALTGKRAQEPK